MEKIQQKVHVYCAEEQGRQSVRKREWEGARGRREIEWWRQAEETGRQATRQLQRVCQAAKSVANYAIQRGNFSPPSPVSTVPCFLSRMLVKTPRRQFFSRIAAAVYGNCVTQRRKANAKKPKATGRMTCENMQMQNIKSEWIELSLVYGSVWATARRRAAGVSGGLPVSGGGDWCYRNCTSPSLNIMDQTQDESCQAQRALIMMSKFALIASEKRVQRTSETPYLNIPCKCLQAWSGTLLHYAKLNFACTWKRSW